jgi:hypothetical protein
MLTQRALLLAACVWTLSGCAPRRAEPPPAAVPREVAGAVIPAGAQSMDINPDRSKVTILVRRAGPLARLGHNHTIVSADESGYVWIGRDLEGSGFEIRLPVDALVVDDPAARAAAGPDFPGEVPEDARQGTYRNMLRPEVLDAERYPLITVTAKRLSGTWEQPVAAASVTLRGTTRQLQAPVDLRREPKALVAKGAFRIRQSDFGITPFSVGGGAIQVADEVEIAFVVVATAR